MDIPLHPRSRSVLSGLVAGLVLALASFALVAIPATAQASIATSTYERRVKHFINVKREQHGLRKVRFEACTDARAEEWARRVARLGRLVHRDQGTILDRCGATFASEALGRGDFGPRALVNAWMQSPLHRDILLSHKARRIGVGSIRDGGAWVTAVNLTRF